MSTLFNELLLFFRDAFPIQREVANSLRGFRSGVSGSDHIIIDVGCEMQPSHWLHTVIPAGPCKTYPSIGEFNADRMGERGNTMEEWKNGWIRLVEMGKSWPDRQRVEGV